MKKALALSALLHTLLFGGGMYTFSAYASKTLPFTSVQVQLINLPAGSDTGGFVSQPASTQVENTHPALTNGTPQLPEASLIKSNPSQTPAEKPKPPVQEASPSPAKPQKQAVAPTISPQLPAAAFSNTARELDNKQPALHSSLETSGQASDESLQSTGKTSAQPFGQASGPAFARYKEPVYPPAAKRQGITGDVLLRLYITENGRAQNIEVIRSPHESLGQAAATALASATFQPYTVEGKAAACWTEIQVRFELH